MKKTTILSFFFILFLFSHAKSEPQNPTPKFSRVKIIVPDKTTLQQIWSTGIDYEGVTGKIGGEMEFVAGEFELQQLAEKNIPFQITVDDLAKQYEQGIAPFPVDALGFGYGSMGGFYTFAEVVKQLDTMLLLYPNVITARESIGTTREGRAVWMVKISDNPNSFEPNEPQVLYTALHHAREPQGMMTLMYYMWWLLENFGEHPEATYLVNNRAMFFIPVMNADGYVYNQTTNPNGGGMWRKNRRNNEGGTFGVDPNRNYGPMYMWDAPNGGSSTSPSSDTYRGTAPFSEPENQAIDNFMRTHNIKSCLNYHTYGNYLIYPFGYLSKENSDSLIYRDIAYEMTNFNNYTNGTDMQTVNYSTRGNSDDYMFGDTTKPRTWTMTPEVGITGFWPTSDEIFPLAIENLGQNKYLAQVAGNTTRLKTFDIVDENQNQFLERGENFAFKVSVRNKGLTKGTNVTIALQEQTGKITFPVPSQTLVQIPAITDTLLIFSGVVQMNAKEGVPFPLVISISDLNGYVWNDTVQLAIGIPTVIFTDNASNGIGNWTAVSGWNTTTTKFRSPPASFTESPNGNYPPNVNATFTINEPLNLATYDYVKLEYWTYFALEPSWDFATVEISTNNGSTWKYLRSKLMQKGSGRDAATQPSDAFGYDGYTPGLTFVKQEIDLSSFLGSNIKLRLHTRADGGEERDGFYVDDIRILGYRESLDSTVIVTPEEITFSGIPGTEFERTLQFFNNTSDSVTVAIAESVMSAENNSVEILSFPCSEKNIVGSIKENISPQQILQRKPVSFSTNEGTIQKAWTTLIEDNRNDNLLLGVDVLRIDYQLRNLPPPIGTLMDMRIIMTNPDSNVLGFVSVDTDQDFGTGDFPVPFGFGLPMRDVGSEFEIVCIFSTQLAESLGIGSLPLAIVVDSETDSLVGLPLLLNVTKDSVLTGKFSVPLGSMYFNDEGNMNIATLFTRTEQNPSPDVAPDIGHGIVGTERGISWMRETPMEFTVASGESLSVAVRALAAKQPGTHFAQLQYSFNGVSSLTTAIQLQVNAPPPPHISISPSVLRDTVEAGDSSSLLLHISNTGAGILYFAVLDTAQTAWLSFVSPFGTLEQNGNAEVEIISQATAISPGTYTAQIIISSNDPTQRTIIKTLSLVVLPSNSINGNVQQLPKDFSLEQNFPNPFNPTTTISFALPKTMYVTLKIFNVLGNEVATLANGTEQAGFHQKTFTASHLPSGLYFYRLNVNNGEYVQTKKLILMK